MATGTRVAIFSWKIGIGLLEIYNTIPFTDFLYTGLLDI